MKRPFSTLAAMTALLFAPAVLSGKGDTVRITITGGDLAGPIEISDPAVASRFDVGTGPGTSPNETQGLNVDWSRGVLEPPKGLQIYEVSFITARRDAGTYVVQYAIDPATNQGFVYLPGKTDAGYRDNVRLILRNVEGNWFRAWSEWEKVAHPLIAKARAVR